MISTKLVNHRCNHADSLASATAVALVARKVSSDLSFQHFVKIASPFDQSTSAESNDERTPAAGPADAGQQAGGSNNGSVSSRPSGRSGQRPRRDRNNRGPARPTESAPREKKFTGRCEELMGEICDCSACNQVDGCTKTTEEVAEHVGRTCSSDARTAVETLKQLTVPMTSKMSVQVLFADCFLEK